MKTEVVPKGVITNAMARFVKKYGMHPCFSGTTDELLKAEGAIYDIKKDVFLQGYIACYIDDHSTSGT